MTAHARFYLLFADPLGGLELMAECALCGALTEASLVLAWEARRVQCSNCAVVLRLDEGVIARLREQAVAALATIDRLK